MSNQPFVLTEYQITTIRHTLEDLFDKGRAAERTAMLARHILSKLDETAEQVTRDALSYYALDQNRLVYEARNDIGKILNLWFKEKE